MPIAASLARTTSGASKEAAVEPATHESPDEILVAWDGEDDPENPVNWSKSRKWRVTGFSCFMCFMCGLNALSIAGAASKINEQFDVSDAEFPNSYWTVTAWSGGAALFPIIFIPVLEDFSVRVGYLIAYTTFVAFVIPQAVAQNYATLIVTRFFAGGCSSIVQNAVANIIGDVWTGEENGLPVSMFVFAYLVGFTLGPVVGAAIASHLHWRWIFYIELILYGALIPLAFLLIEETRDKILLKRRAARLSKATGKPIRVLEEDSRPLSLLLYDSTVRPVYLLFTEPVVFFFTLWSALSIGTIFVASQSILQVFEANYGFSEVDVGYVQGSMVVGEIIGLFIGLWANRIHHNSAKKNTINPGQPIPESRLTLSVPASFIGLAGGLFIYAWTSYPSVHWIAPTIGLGIVGVGIMVVVQSAAQYITDAYSIWAGSAIAAVAAIENLFSAFLPLSAQAMYTRLGFRWASTLLALIALALSFAPLVLYLKGPEVRRRSKWMASI